LRSAVTRRIEFVFGLRTATALAEELGSTPKSPAHESMRCRCRSRAERGLPRRRMTRILFVDEDPDCMAQLEELRRYHRDWQLSFASSAHAALAELERAPVDVVVSDLELAGADGAELLKRVKECHPQTVRIALSASTDSSLIARALPVSHQFISKPCDFITLQNLLHRTSELRRVFAHAAAHEFVGFIDKLPSVPDVYWELSRALASRYTGSAEIAGIIERDPAMCSRLLQIVNSAFFGLARCITSIPEAVAYVGTEVLRGLMLQQLVFASMQDVSVEGFSIERFQQHSLQVAKLAKPLVATPKLAHEAFTAGLIHDIGRVVIAFTDPKRYGAVLRETRRSNRPLHVVEKEMLGTCHAEVGAYLLGVWGLPLSIVETVAFHHQPVLCVNADCEVLAAVHVADALCDIDANAQDAALVQRMDTDFLNRAGLTNIRSRALGLAHVAPGPKS
jgi:HD-like signal output (HDOD) protein